MRTDLEKRLAALEAATAPPPPAPRVEEVIVRPGEAIPPPSEGVDFQIVHKIVRPRWADDASAPPREIGTVTIGRLRAEPSAEPAGVTRMPLMGRD